MRIFAKFGLLMLFSIATMGCNGGGGGKAEAPKEFAPPPPPPVADGGTGGGKSKPKMPGAADELTP